MSSQYDSKFLQEVVKKTQQNATLLLNEAQQLFDGGSRARGVALALLSCEEMSKAVMLHERRQDASSTDWDDFFANEWRDHKKKTWDYIGRLGEFGESVAEKIQKPEVRERLDEKSLRELEEALAAASARKEHELHEVKNGLNDIKNYMLYLSVVDGKIADPSQAASGEEAALTLNFARHVHEVLKNYLDL